jgi:hypothetical protein
MDRVPVPIRKALKKRVLKKHIILMFAERCCIENGVFAIDYDSFWSYYSIDMIVEYKHNDCTK